jgi:hypothetical protein
MGLRPHLLGEQGAPGQEPGCLQLADLNTTELLIP